MALGQPHEFCEPRQVEFVRLGGRIHELRKLQMDAHDVGTEVLHLQEVLLYRRPVRIPIVLNQPKLVISVIIEAPWNEGFTRGCENKTSAIVGNGHRWNPCS